jgi:two-component system, response regulator
MNRLVLLVEDNEDDELLTIDALKTAGIASEVAIARDGAEALDYVFGSGDHSGRRDGLLPSVVILDLRLPKIPGLEVLRRIRANDRTRRLPVVVLTSSDEESDLKASYANGANSYVRKPVHHEEFRRAVQELGLYWLIRNFPPVE